MTQHEVQPEPRYQHLGTGRKIVDGPEKITGRAQYVADLRLPGMLHIRPVLSPYAHARIVSIDASAARQVPGVVAVLTAQDLPTRDRAINSRHSAVLAQERVLFRGQPVVAVVAESEHAAQDGADAVLIDYEQLPAVIDPLQALAADAPVIWPDGLPEEGADMTAAHAAVDKETVEQEGAPSNLHAENHYRARRRGAGLPQADVIIERVYRTPFVHQGYMEPCAAAAEPGVMGQSITIYTSTQGQFTVRDEIRAAAGAAQTQGAGRSDDDRRRLRRQVRHDRAAGRRGGAGARPAGAHGAVALGGFSDHHALARRHHRAENGRQERRHADGDPGARDHGQRRVSV